MKVITICGSLKFESEMKYWSERLELDGNCVLSVIYPNREKDNYTQEEIDNLTSGHKKKIDLSDAIFVINKGGYMGNSVKSEIEYAKTHHKEILFLEN